jgi:hypothetical protein
MHLVRRPDRPFSTFSQRTQVADELDLVRDQVDRTRNVGRESKLPGDDTGFLLFASLKVASARYPSVSSERRWYWSI